MTRDRHQEGAGELRLAPESIETLARRLAELLRPADAPTRPRRLLTAAEVSQWWGVERSWVYAHADDLGARRLGAGPRPRLRFDPDDVAERLGPTRSAVDDGRSPGMTGDRARTRFRGAPELTSSRPRNRPGGAATPPATAPKTWPSAR
jgi:hypothetical protein